VTPVSGPTWGSAAPVAAADALPVDERALDAVMRCVARYGVSKTTIDDVAREAGCARATLYRYFAGKSELVRAAVAREVGALATEMVALGEAAPSVEEAVVAIVTHGSRRIVGHDALQFVLRCESEVLLPYLTFSAGDRFLADAGALVAHALHTHLAPEPASRAGEWVARVAFAYLTPAGSPVDMTDEAQVRELVRSFVLPGLLAAPVDPITR
jgi:AcrR family transcriptional regulator